jgi:hypothetical protein
MSVDALEVRWKPPKRILNPRLLFLLLFIASNLTILPLYYRSEKENLRGLVTFLKDHLKEGDKISYINHAEEGV